MGARDREELDAVENAPPSELSRSTLLREMAEQLRLERELLARHSDSRSIAAAERDVLAELAPEARRRLREAVARRAEEARVRPAVVEGDHQRFSLLFRLQHIGLFVSTLVLIATGLPLRYAEVAWAQAFFRWIGGVPVQAATHRAAATLLIGVGAFHVCYIAFSREGRRELLALLPRAKDFADLFRNLAYFVGLVRTRPRFDRFSYVEKFDYWAVYWGIVIMVGSGLLLWSPAVAMRHLPKYILDIAHIVHSDEALLAATAIIVWHFYNTHLNPECFPMNWAWLTGRISKERLLEHHPVEYERIYGSAKAGAAQGELSE